MTCESAGLDDSADAAEGGQSHASKGKEQSEQHEMSYTPQQALQLQCTMRMLARFYDLWSRCGVSLSPLAFALG